MLEAHTLLLQAFSCRTHKDRKHCRLVVFQYMAVCNPMDQGRARGGAAGESLSTGRAWLEH